MEAFKQLILRRKRGEARFRITRFVEDVPEMLKLCYIREVEARGRQYVDDEDTNEHIAKAAKWLTGGSPRAGLFMYGTTGNGKTTLANAIRQLISLMFENASYDERKGVRAISALQLADFAKAEKSETFYAIKKAELLHIDDVGCEPISVKVWGNEISPIVETLYYRYDNCLFTIITSNLEEEEIVKRYGERIADRFLEMFDLLPFENRSYRKNQR